MGKVEDNTEMTTLSACLDRLRGLGYDKEFSVIENRLVVEGAETSYSASEIKVDNFYRFEGESDPDDSSILYAIETADGHKGTLIDSYGYNSDTAIDKFIHGVKEIDKKIDNKPIAD